LQSGGAHLTGSADGNLRGGSTSTRKEIWDLTIKQKGRKRLGDKIPSTPARSRRGKTGSKKEIQEAARSFFL